MVASRLLWVLLLVPRAPPCAPEPWRFLALLRSWRRRAGETGWENFSTANFTFLYLFLYYFLAEDRPGPAGTPEHQHQNIQDPNPP